MTATHKPDWGDFAGSDLVFSYCSRQEAKDWQFELVALACSGRGLRGVRPQGTRTILASPHGHRHDGAFRERRTPPIQANPGAILMSG
jgi:hypothetical protein